ncbi:MAG TPA: aspartate-semialdehyde dehydrogenase [Vicinamibacterales bacterium]|nr:aspartate-semialdehyde dehydrogenase [Vicinamibacterales bacterium]
MHRTIDVGVLGATGMVGQQFVVQLARHPWFRLAWVGASDRSAGKKYADAVSWRLPEPLPDDVARLTVEPCEPGNAPEVVFSAMDAAVAGPIEQAFAAAGRLVVSNSRNHRMDADVPLLVPEINADHIALIEAQRRQRGWSGAIVTNPNCSTVVLTMVLAPLRVFGLRKVMVTTLQALSGAGYPGVPSFDAVANVIPFIDGEEAKIETETRKILGALAGDRVEPHQVIVSAQTTRVPVVNGHTEAISVTLDSTPSIEEVRAALEGFSGPPQRHALPSAPAQPIVYREEPNRPQPRLDVNRDGGMTVTVGRLRPCPVLGYKFFALGHNTVRGAAGAAVLNAELMAAEGVFAAPVRG